MIVPVGVPQLALLSCLRACALVGVVQHYDLNFKTPGNDGSAKLSPDKLTDLYKGFLSKCALSSLRPVPCPLAPQSVCSVSHRHDCGQSCCCCCCC
jgi:hypothetical protein